MRSLAAMTSDEVQNLSVAAAARAARADLRVVLRAGGGVASESRGLFRVGFVADLYPIGGAVLAAAALGSEAREGFLHDDTAYLVTPDGRIEPSRAADGAGQVTRSEDSRGEPAEAGGPGG